MRVFSDGITTKLQSASVTDHPKSSDLRNGPAFQVGFQSELKPLWTGQHKK